MLPFIDPAIVLSMFMLPFIDPAIVLSMLMLPFICIIVCCLFWVDTNLCSFFYRLYLYMYCRRGSSYQEGEVGIPLIGLTPPHLCAWFSQDLVFRRHLSWSHFIFSGWGERRLFVLVILVELLTSTVKTFCSWLLTVLISNVSYISTLMTGSLLFWGQWQVIYGIFQHIYVNILQTAVIRNVFWRLLASFISITISLGFIQCLPLVESQPFRYFYTRAPLHCQTSFVSYL